LILGLAGCATQPAAAPQGAKPALGNEVVASADVVTKSGAFKNPLDSTPNPAEDTIYFTATGNNGKGVFRVPAAGGAAEEVATGAPFLSPRGIAISTDGKQVYVADTQAGQILVVPAAGGKPAPLPGTLGAAPRGMDVVNMGGADMVYFTGIDPADGKPAVMKIASAGDKAPTVIVKGAPLVAPDAVVMTKAGVLYVSDQSAGSANSGAVFKVAGGTATRIADNLKLGEPGGVALTPDDGVLLVSSIDKAKGTDQVLLIDLGSLQTGLVTAVVGENHAAGGVHRASGKGLFSWADSEAGGRGSVYIIRLH